MAQPFQNHTNNSITSYKHNNNSSFNTTINRPINTPTKPPKPSAPQIDAQTIFHDPTSSTDPRWYWRITMEASRKDPRNMKYYINYVGSKGARSFENNSNSSNKKPDHYKKHLAKIGCPLHDLYDIFHKDLCFTVHPTICAHKSWKCPSFSSYSKHNLLATISMNDIGLEWKRGAFSVRPLHIKYNNFSTDLYIKRIANTNFNKVFRPGCFGNLPSVKKGSWKQGKVFYVFKNDKLVFNIGNNIILIFELSSPSTIIKSSKNKHDIIDGWKNIVGGVGFYTCSETQQNIATVLILRKSTEFPIECIQQSKIKILVKGTHFSGNKLIIGSKTFSLNVKFKCRNNNDIDNDYSSISTSCSRSSFGDERKQSDEKLNSIMNRMKSTFDSDNSILLQRNQLLNGKINQLKTINKQFMELNSQLMQERDQLVNQLHTLQNRQLIHNPLPVTQPQLQPQPQPQIVMNNYNNVTHTNPMISTHINNCNTDRRGRDRDRNMRYNSEHIRHGSRSRSRDRKNNENNNVNNVNEDRNMINVNGYGNESPVYSVSDRSVRSWSTASNEALYMNNYGINANMISMEPMNINEMDNNSMYMDMNNMNFNHSTSPRALMNGMNDNNSIMNDPMFYGTYTD